MSDEFVHLIEGFFAHNLPVIVRSKGGSMRPTIPRESVVRIEAVDPESIKIGDVVLYVQDGTYTVMHRVVRRIRKNGAYFIQTWGDNVGCPDAPVMLTAIKAKVTAYQTKEGEWCTLKPSLQIFIKMFLLRYCWYWCGRLFSRVGLSN